MRGSTLQISGECQRRGFLGAFLFVYRDVAQLVARAAGGREVAGSSPVIPTIVWYNRICSTLDNRWSLLRREESPGSIEQ